MPEHHFVINASQAATAHTVRRYPFLKLHEEQGLSEVQRELSGEPPAAVQPQRRTMSSSATPAGISKGRIFRRRCFWPAASTAN